MKTLKRIFQYNGQDLPDPNPEWQPDEVRKSYANQYAELNNATIKGPTLEGDTAVYSFETAVGTKG